MSLDVYLYARKTCPSCGCGIDSREKVYSANITHNLGKMADHSGLYRVLWHPEEVGISLAGDLIAPLMLGIAHLEGFREECMALSPQNGWGTYEGLLKFCKDYLVACRKYPTAAVEVSR